MKTNTVYHGATQKHETITKGNWISTSLDEAVLFAFIRSIDRQSEMFIAEMNISSDDYTAMISHEGFVNSVLNRDVSDIVWHTIDEIRPKLSVTICNIIKDTTKVFDITELIKQK